MSTTCSVGSYVSDSGRETSAARLDHVTSDSEIYHECEVESAAAFTSVRAFDACSVNSTIAAAPQLHCVTSDRCLDTIAPHRYLCVLKWPRHLTSSGAGDRRVASGANVTRYVRGLNGWPRRRTLDIHKAEYWCATATRGVP
ncbi:hypothetical protein ACJJTC_007553 [Scirpophaga incertulas]